MWKLVYLGFKISTIVTRPTGLTRKNGWITSPPQVPFYSGHSMIIKHLEIPTECLLHKCRSTLSCTRNVTELGCPCITPYVPWITHPYVKSKSNVYSRYQTYWTWHMDFPCPPGMTSEYEMDGMGWVSTSRAGHLYRLKIPQRESLALSKLSH